MDCFWLSLKGGWYSCWSISFFQNQSVFVAFVKLNVTWCIVSCGKIVVINLNQLALSHQDIKNNRSYIFFFNNKLYCWSNGHCDSKTWKATVYCSENSKVHSVQGTGHWHKASHIFALRMSAKGTWGGWWTWVERIGKILPTIIHARDLIYTESWSEEKKKHAWRKENMAILEESIFTWHHNRGHAAISRWGIKNRACSSFTYNQSMKLSEWQP